MKAKLAGFLLAAFFAAPRAHAASVLWSGAGDGVHWSDPANWNLAFVPGPADDVAITTNVTVRATATISVAVNSLTLGDAVAVPRLVISTAADVAGLTRIRTGSVLHFDTTFTWTSGQFTADTGAILTHSGTLEVSSAAVRIVTQVFNLPAGASVDLAGKGFRGGDPFTDGFGPGKGGRGQATRAAGGAGHGGTGGDGGNSSAPTGAGGVVYGNGVDPTELGSGGGGGNAPCGGGSGGGAFILTAATATINGTVDASGSPSAFACGDAGAGGSGGTINVRVGNLYGSGIFRSNGGAGGNGALTGGGGGGGGRVALVSSGTFVGNPTVEALPGAGGTGNSAPNNGVSGLSGAPYIDPKVYIGGGADQSNCSDAANWYGNTPPQSFENVVFGSTSPTKGCVWNVVLPFGGLGSVRLLPSYQGIFTWNIAFTSVTGSFNIAGGTVTMGGNFNLEVGGDWLQTGGKVEMTVGTVTFRSNGSQTISQMPGSFFRNVRMQNAAGTVTTGSDIQINGNFTPSTRYRNASSGHTLRLRGELLSDPIGGVGDTTWEFNGTSQQRVSTGPYYAARVANSNGVVFTAVSSPTIGPGDFHLAAGASVSLINRVVNLSGGFRDDGATINWSGSTVAFLGSGTAVVRATNTVFEHVRVQNPSGVVEWHAPSIVNRRLSLEGSGSLALVNGATLTVRGDWIQTAVSSFSAGSGAVAFAGTTPQVVTSSGMTPFNHFIASNAVSIRLSTDTRIDGDLILQRGLLDFSTRTLLLGGSFLRLGTSSAPAVALSTVVLSGAGLQRINLGAGTVDLHTLIVRNAGAGARMDSDLRLLRDFTVDPGAVFNGVDRALTMGGSSATWRTAGALYTSSGTDAHRVYWHPVFPSTGTLFVAAGSTVHARVEVSSETNARLLGPFSLAGPANTFVLTPGSRLDARGSTITLRGSSDLLFPGSANVAVDAGTWFVFEGSGVGRGAAISTGPYSNLRFSPELATATLRLPSAVFQGHVVIDSGTLMNFGGATLSLFGHLINAGGAVDFSDQSTGTLRFMGSADQRLLVRAGDRAARFEVASSSSVSLLQGDWTVTRRLELASGDFKGGSSRIDLDGDWNSVGGRFLCERSTVVFSSGGTGAVQTFTDVTGAQFNGLELAVSTMVFQSTFTAAVLTNAATGSLMLFSPVVGASYQIHDLRLDGSLPATRIRMESSLPGNQFDLNVISVSTVTAVAARDSRAVGVVIQANDGLSLDAGGNANWNFLPQVIVLAPGETFAEGVGRGGAPTPRTAGAPFSVSVRAVSDRFRSVPGASAQITIQTTDSFDAEPAALPLVAGQQNFTVDLRSADPAPLPIFISAVSTGVFTSSAATVFVSPDAFVRLQVLLPGETAVPGSALGKTGVPNAQVTGQSFPAIVRGTDQFWNAVPGAVDIVKVTTQSPAAVSLPGSQALASGLASVSPVVFNATGAFVLLAYDLSNGAITPSTSAAFNVFSPQVSSPTIAFSIPLGATVATLAGGLSGTASDSVAVIVVKTALRDLVTGQYFDWTAQSFSLAAPDFRNASLTPPNGLFADWIAPLSDARLNSGRDYYVVAVASNPSLNVAIGQSTFTYNPALLQFAPSDGQGQASLTQTIEAGCRPIISTVTFRVGSSGIGPGGAAALRLPDGWTRLKGVSSAATPALGYVRLNSTSTAFTAAGSSSILVEPAAFGGAELGENWLVVAVTTNAVNGFRPGEDIQFVYHGHPPSGRSGLGAQYFDARARASGAGSLVGLSTAPVMTLLPGPARALAFTEYGQIAVGPLQTSATMQLMATDACANAAPLSVGATIQLSAGVLSPSGFLQDLSAQFFLAGGAPAPASVFMAAGASAGPSFYFRTSTAGLTSETIRASGSVDASTAAADRLALLRSAAVAPAALTIGTGTIGAGATSAYLLPGDAAGAVRLRFTVADPQVAWEVLLATETSFTTPLVRRSGLGDPARPVDVLFDGIVCEAGVCAHLPAGTYPVRVKAGGLASSQALEIRVAPSPSIFGNLSSLGFRAAVFAEGSGAGYGAAARASATGYFQLSGLKAATAYNVRVSTSRLLGGQLVDISTRIFSVTASLPGTDLGTVLITTPSFLRLSVGLPVPAPQEIWGRAFARSLQGPAFAVGTLHFSSGSARSDDGRTAVGLAASTWTVLPVAPGNYAVDVELFEVGISSTLGPVAVAPAGFSDLNAALARRANVYGYAVLPDTRPLGGFVSVSARRQDQSAPGIFGAAHIVNASTNVAVTSAPFSLFGLEPGSWSLRAEAFGYAPASATLFVPSAADIGDPSTGAGGPRLTLALGGAATGTLTVLGDTRRLGGTGGGFSSVLSTMGFVAAVRAYDASSFERAAVFVALAVHPTATASTFTLAGLPPGRYVIDAELPGFSRSALQAPEVSVTAAAPFPGAPLTLIQDAARASFRIDLPAATAGQCLPSTAFETVGVSLRSAAAAPIASGDLTRLAGLGGASVSLHCTSMTFVTPALPAGYAEAEFLHGPTRNFSRLSLPLALGSTTQAWVDLTKPTFSVTGKLTLSGPIAFQKSTFTLSVSSPAGLLAHATTQSYCLLSSTLPVSLTAARVELLPVERDESVFIEGLRRSTAGACAVYEPSGRPALLAFAAALQTDGSFDFGGLPPGGYRLRTSGDLDGDPGNGAEWPAIDKLVRVSTYSGLSFLVDAAAGRSVSGRVSLPSGVLSARAMRVSLTGSDGRQVAGRLLQMAGASSRDFTLDRILPGEYSLSVFDDGQPPAFVARPQRLQVGQADRTGVEVQLEPAGAVRGRLGIEAGLSAAATAALSLIGRDTRGLLPSSLRISAAADPWFDGGFVEAQRETCGGTCDRVEIDEDGRFRILGMPPGLYTVEFYSEAGSEEASGGTLELAPERRAAVSVEGGRTTDLGAVRLRAAVALSGRLTSAADGAAAPNVAVTARPSVRAGGASPRNAEPSTRSDRDGRYRLSGLDPEVRYYDVIAGERGEDARQAPPAFAPVVVSGVDLHSTATLNIALPAAALKLAGRIVSADSAGLESSGLGAPEAGALVHLQRAGVLPRSDPLGDLAQESDSSGRFSFVGVAAGDYRLTATALGHAPRVVAVRLSTASLDLGDLYLSRGAALSGSLRLPSGEAPGEDEVAAVFGTTADAAESFVGTVVRDPVTRAAVGYRLSGFRAGQTYRLAFQTGDGDLIVPSEARNLVFVSSAEARVLDVTLRRPRPFVASTSRKSGGDFLLEFEASHPLRARTAADDDLTLILSTVSGSGLLSARRLSSDRRRVSAVYTPSVADSSFTVRLRAYSSRPDFDSLDSLNREFLAVATFTFYSGLTGYHRASIPNLAGGGLSLEDDGGRLQLPKGAFFVDADSSVLVALQSAGELLTQATVLQAQGLSASDSNIRSLAHAPEAYPEDLLRAMAASPPGLTPYSPFYDVLLPAGIRTQLARPAQLTLRYSTAAAVSGLNVYWYNPAANSYILQQDATGAPAVIDPFNRTMTIHVDHFSTFVLFNTGVSVISGGTYSGGQIDAFNFPNPFDLSVKTVTPIHGAPPQTVRGTLIRFAVPPGLSGSGKIDIFNVAGERVRTIDAGHIRGGEFYYQGWDGRNDNGRDCASGVYIGQVKVGGKSAFFKMALIK